MARHCGRHMDKQAARKGHHHYGAAVGEVSSIRIVELVRAMKGKDDSVVGFASWDTLLQRKLSIGKGTVPKRDTL